MVMQKKNLMEIIVGIFIIAGILALFLLALKVSGLSKYSERNTITITAVFDDIGDLKVRAPVKVAGVKIGEVHAIKLDPKTFRADVAMLIDENSLLPIDSSASILSVSLLGSNYIAITPGFSEEAIKDGGNISETHPAVILENLIGQAIFTPKKESK
jgi:phospholipid/cholesterol/gamma-HCH transport system substrate-binding protein